MGGGSSGGGDSTTTTVQQLSPEQKELLKLTTPIMADYLKGGVGGLSGMVYPGSTVSGMNPTQVQGQQMALAGAQGAQGAVQPTIDANTWLGSGGALNPATNPGLQGTINAAVRPLQENFTNTVLPNIRDSAIQSGGFGSNRMEINNRLAANDLNRSVGDVSSAITFQGYNAGLDAMNKAQAFAPGIWQGAATPGATVGAVGSQTQSQQQAELQGNISQFYNQKFLPLQIAQSIAGSAFGYPGGSTVANSSGGGGGGGSGGMNALGGALGGAAAGSMFGPWGAGIGAGLGALLTLF